MGEKARVLIVSDDEAICSTCLRSLECVFCNTEFVSDSEEAIRAMKLRPFDVVLLDIQTPDRDGLAVLRTIKQNWPDSEVVIITGNPTVASAKEAVRLGAYDYVAKPVRPSDMINLTDSALTHKNWALHEEHSE